MFKDLPNKNTAYAVTAGDYCGEVLVYIKPDKESYKFLSLPKLIKLSIPHDKFEFGISNDILDVVEELPDDIYDFLVSQYNSCK